MRRPTHNTTGLPRALREELGIEDKYKPGPSKLNKRSSRGELSRKDRRKAERSHKKDTWSRNEGQEVSQNSRHDNVKPRPGRSARAEEQPKSILKKRKYPEESELGQDDESDFEIDLDESDDEEMQDEDTDKDSQPVASRVPRAVQEKLAEDDAEIAALEKKLGLKGKKKLPKTFQEDGLADLLGDLGSDSETEDKKRKREGDEWLQRKRQKAQMDLGNSEEESEDSEDSEDIDMNEDDTDNMSEDFDEENDEDPSDDAESDFEGFDDEEKEEDPTVQKTKQRENPYRAPISTSEVASAKYIPPSKRLQLSTESESTLRLRRQVQGHLNKLSEANLISILGDIEKLYQDYSRQSVTSMLIELLLGMMCCGSSLNDTFVILQAGFIAAVYKVIGMEFGAEFVQNIVERLDTMYEREDKDDAARKDMTNLISLLSHLYNFHVIGCSLMFDYIRLFLSKINEVNTELLLKVVRNCGPQLRQDDPSALKDIVLLIQPAITQIGEAALSVRTKFMIEIITDLKNNRLKNAPGASISLEHLTKMKKILGSLNTRNIRATEPLRISRADIRNSEKRGKWWLVGASWKAEPTGDPDNQKPDLNPNAVLPDTLDDDMGNEKAIDLLQLAKSQRMNTDVRRSIFIAIMSASDYQDAHVRLTKLRLKRSQETEIPQVLIRCAAEEETSNPYYTLIARKLCSEKKMKMAFQFSLWDTFKRMGERGNLEDDHSGDEDDDEDRSLSMRAVVNLAKLYGSLIADGGLTLGVLKTLDFLYLQPKTRVFVELLLITAMQQTQQKVLRKQQKTGASEVIHFDEQSLVNLFLKARDTPQVIPGLIYFIRKVVAKSDVVTSKRDRKLLKWGCRLALDTLKVISEGEKS